MTILKTWTCAHGEQVDEIALKAYGDEKYAADIFAANPLMDDKLVFEGGEVINMPEVSVGADTEYDAPWR